MGCCTTLHFFFFFFFFRSRQTLKLRFALHTCRRVDSFHTWLSHTAGAGVWRLQSQQVVLYSRLLNANSRPDEEPTTEGENREVWPYRISSERRGNKEVPCSVAGRRWTRSSPRSLQPLPSAAALLSPASDSASCSGQDGATWRAAAGGVQRLAVKPPPPGE